MKENNFDISTTLRKKPKYKKIFWQEIKEEVLGKEYELSLVFIGDKLSQKLNKDFREKDHRANIISFPISENMGEIFINFPNAQKEAEKWIKKEKDKNGKVIEKKRSSENFIDFLLVHGLTHLKGFDHIDEKEAEEMEKFEEKIRSKFKI